MAADFYERRWVGDFVSPGKAIDDAVEALRNRGATFVRLTPRGFEGLAQQIIAEGWREPPADQGDEPL